MTATPAVVSAGAVDTQGSSAGPQSGSRMPTAPSVTLPKGGGAIHGMGEKFDVAPSTGASNASLPIHTSGSRDGLEPHLELRYSSGAGNGPFGLGWQLETPSITRKTDKGLPRYTDMGPDSEADVFLLSDSEDLVPMFERDSSGLIVQRPDGTPVIQEITKGEYRVRRYSPRIDTGHLRIERWQKASDPSDIYWRVISAQNITTIYGKNESSRIIDPEGGDGQTRNIFTWLVTETFDDQGNAMVFRYKQENSENVDTLQPHETNRSPVSRSSNKYLKTIFYGNRHPNRDLVTWASTSASEISGTDWLFSVVFDYGEHDLEKPTPIEAQPWPCRLDPFSTSRSCFEIRTYRLCRRVLMFHHFEELGQTPLLVTSMDFEYQENPVATFLRQGLLAGYSPDGADQGYVKRITPPVRYEYEDFPSDDQLAQVILQDVDSGSLENLPAGIDGTTYQWVDLYSEGLTGILTEEGNNWYYKRNTSANNIFSTNQGHDPDGYTEGIAMARLGLVELVGQRPSPPTTDGLWHFGDVDGDGQLDLVEMQPGSWGFFERTADEGWTELRVFPSFPNVSNRDVKLVDLTGDGLSDILIAEDRVFYWYPSLGQNGYGASRSVTQAIDENRGPTSLFSDTEQTIYLADMSGDGLSDLVRVCNGSICYWPNTGYGTFGPMVLMDNAPWFESVDIFDVKKVHLADIDGSGATDLLYIHSGGVDIYLNQSGNGFADRKLIESFPANDSLASVNVVDLLGNGTMCVVWSTTAPSCTPQLKYLDITKGKKPHLLRKVVNNLGSETIVHYSPSTKFYLQDMEEGRPWITKLPFPVQCVETVETIDRISKNRFITRYRYHDGFFDGLEREFRGFAMVEEWDTDDFAAMSSVDASNVDASWHVPPRHTKSWFHTGVYINNDKISKQWAHHYFGAPESADSPASDAFLSTLVDDTVLPDVEMGADELREAFRALKGHVLRVEVYSDDGTDKAKLPYDITESNYTILALQPRQDPNLHSVFMVHPRETLHLTYERNVEDPRIHHELLLDVDRFGNALKTIQVAYPRQPGKSPLPDSRDKKKQQTVLFLYTENDVTNVVDNEDNFRVPIGFESRTFELSGLTPSRGSIFRMADFTQNDFAPITSLPGIPYEQPNNASDKQKRLVRRSRMVFRRDNLTGLLPAGQLENNAIPGCSYKLCFTPGLLSKIYMRQGAGQQPENLLPDPASTLGGSGEEGAGYVNLDVDGSWWRPDGRVFYHLDPSTQAAQELAEARAHFFTPRRFTDSFGNSSLVTYDGYDLLLSSTKDAFDNEIVAKNDYRVLSPVMMTDANGNRKEVVYDSLGYVVGAAHMGKGSETLGDSLAGFKADLSQGEIDAFFRQPTGDIAHDLLGNSSSRVVYNPTRFWNDATKTLPAFVATILRETHASDLQAGEKSRLQITVDFSDGFGRVIQTKALTKAGPLTDNGPTVDRRWIGSGWTIFNNKGKPVRQYEPFFDDTHDFKFDMRKGVSSVMFYDPLLRVVGKLHANKTLEKTRFDAWSQTTFDVNDNVLVSAPKSDEDIGRYMEHLPDHECVPSWYDDRISGRLGQGERAAAVKAAVHASTPTTAHLDVLGRPILTIRDNGADGELKTRTSISIMGEQYEVFDAAGRLVMTYGFDIAGSRVHQSNIDSGERWILPSADGNILLLWNSRNLRHRSVLDADRRLVATYVRDGDGAEILVGQNIYGETLADAAAHNLRETLYRVRDQAGTLTSLDCDFKGNIVTSERQFAVEYKQLVDWSQDVHLEAEKRVTRTTFDALNRAVDITSPDGTISHHEFDAGGWLHKVLMNLRGEQPPGNASTWTPMLTDTDYNARGQTTSITHGNSVRTLRAYDPYTFRQTRIQAAKSSTPQQQLQDLNYVYDPVGNCTSLRDNAQPTIFFRNNRVDPSQEFTYDAVYRLQTATGREHVGQNNGPVAPSPTGEENTGQPLPGDDSAMARYLESYSYDIADNMTKINHAGSDDSKPGWTRTLTYESNTNRLLSSSTGRVTENYSYEGREGLHGLMTQMPHLSSLSWDFLDRLKSSSRQAVKDGIPETTYYVYDMTGERARKVTERYAAPGESPTKLKERYYIGSCEKYREYAGDGGTVTLERESLSLMGADGRLALIETRTVGIDGSPQRIIRYQYNNNIGSATLELDQEGQIISYEEYTPYGNTSYQASSSQVDVPKRYRYSGKERDDESGLYYCGARYYAPWISRWISPDPLGIQDGLNLYEYVGSNPITHVDPTGHGTVETITTNAPAGTESGKNMAELIRQSQKSGGEIKTEVVIKSGKGGSTLDVLRDNQSFENRSLNAGSKTYTKASGPAGLNTGAIKSSVKSKLKNQVTKHIDAIAEARKNAHEALEGRSVTRETMLITVKGISQDKEVAKQQLKEIRKAAREAANEVEQATGKKIAVGVVDENHPRLKQAAAARKAREQAGKADEVAHDVSKLAHGPSPGPAASALHAGEGAAGAASKLGKVAKPLMKVAGGAMKVLDVVDKVEQVSTLLDPNASEEARVRAGLHLTADVLQKSPNPVLRAAGTGLSIGNTLEDELHVSEVSSRWGVDANVALREAGYGETTALVGGAVVTVVSTPVAIGVAAYRKVAGWFE